MLHLPHAHLYRVWGRGRALDEEEVMGVRVVGGQQGWELGSQDSLAPSAISGVPLSPDKDGLAAEPAGQRLSVGGSQFWKTEVRPTLWGSLIHLIEWPWDAPANPGFLSPPGVLGEAPVLHHGDG